MRYLLCFCLIAAMVGAVQATPSIGDEIVGHADIGFELVIKKATPTSAGAYAVLGKIRFEGVADTGEVISGSGMLRIREFSGFDPAQAKRLSGSGLLRFQGGISEIYGDASYDVGLYGDLQVETLDSYGTNERVMSVKSSIVVGQVLVRRPTD